MIALLRELRQREGLPLLFVTPHPLALVPTVNDRVTVMHSGRIVEQLPSSGLRQATHPYTQALLAAVPALIGPANGAPPRQAWISAPAVLDRAPLRGHQPTPASAGAMKWKRSLPTDLVRVRSTLVGSS